MNELEADPGLKRSAAALRERVRNPLSGWLVLPVALALPVGAFHFFRALQPAAGVACLLLFALTAKGFFTLQPKEARVLVLFGRYVGTVRRDGFHWANPFAVLRGPFTPMQVAGKPGEAATLAIKPRFRISLRTRIFETATLKVNDQRGNPIEIGGVVVWRVHDTAKALFEVDDYEAFVRTQGETALRQLANRYPYDHTSDHGADEITLRDDGAVVSEALREELAQRLAGAGVVVEEARLTHLAYAPEIAQTMLRRQAAEAVIAARRKIVEGAVSMVEMALDELTRKQVLVLDDSRRAAMVANLLVVLCGESQAEPMINTGTAL